MILTIVDNIKAPVKANQIYNAEWETISTVLLSFIEATEKTDVKLFNLWDFKTVDFKKRWDGAISRCKDNAQACWGLVLDFDNDKPQDKELLKNWKPKSITDAVAELVDYEFVLYTTFRHGVDKITNEYDGLIDRFRIILPFENQLSFDDMTAKKQAFLDNIDNADPASFSATQAFYFHSGQFPEHAISFRNHGKFINPADFESKPPIVDTRVYVNTKAAPTKPLEEYTRTVLDRLGQIRGMHYDDSLLLATAVKGSGGDFSDYDQIRRVVTASDSTFGKKSMDFYRKDYAKAGDKIKKSTVNELLTKYNVKPLSILVVR